MNASAPRSIAVLVTPVLPEPGGSGRAWRAWDWLQELARDHHVHVVICDSSLRPHRLPDGYPARSVHWLCNGAVPTRRFSLLVGWAIPPLVIWSRRFAMDWIHSRSSAACMVELSRIAPPVARLVAFRLYTHDIACSIAHQLDMTTFEIDLDDLESATRDSVAGALWRLRRPIEAAMQMSASHQYRLLENSLPWRCARIWLAAEEDCETLRQRLPNASIAIRPNRIRAFSTAPRTAAPATLRVLFVGTLDYAPNEEGAIWLAEQIVPRLRDRLPRGWGVDIAGRHPSARLAARLARQPEVTLHVAPPDLGHLYASAAIVVIPLRAGGGTKLKTVEAVMHERVLVSTREGVRGLDLRNEEHCLIADSPADFATAIVRLASDARLADTLASSAHRHLAAHGHIDAQPHLRAPASETLTPNHEG